MSELNSNRTYRFKLVSLLSLTIITIKLYNNKFTNNKLMVFWRWPRKILVKLISGFELSRIFRTSSVGQSEWSQQWLRLILTDLKLKRQTLNKN